MYTLLVLLALAQPPMPPQPANAPSGTAPEQVVASIDAKGKFTIVHVTCNCYGPAQENTVEVPGKEGRETDKGEGQGLQRGDDDG